ncbi:DUF6174 domain-containing protein [Streptomyces niveiscabiei]|uniref:DUF6174 domain-containing protein n=1 Tax=Streptomyces niveiscabiei TaxID=164115 RepID=A0ABW9HLC5_9ACTN|nr:DUF6174 domain-containing protein [Streptomyces niveiscabiei]
MTTARHLSVLTLAVALTTTACGETRTYPGADPTWREPGSYTYTLAAESQVLAGTFRITVRNGKVTAVTAPDPDSRRQAAYAELPTIGALLSRLKTARANGADTAAVEYAPGGRPTRVVLDEDRNAVDDEATYVISAFSPAGAGPG